MLWLLLLILVPLTVLAVILFIGQFASMFSKSP